MTTSVPTTPEARKKWLLDPNNRDPLVRGGAGSIYFTGDVSDPKKLKLVISTRAKAAGEGLAHFGGLSEDEDTVENDSIATGINNAYREGREEMAELLGYEPEIDKAGYIPLYTAHDDGYFIKNGEGFAVNARLHAHKMSSDLYGTLFPNGSTKRYRDANYKGEVETSHAEVMSFMDAIKRQDDFFYAHEYFALWVMASKVMNWDVMAIVATLNTEQPAKPIDFNRVADRMHTDVATLETYLGSEYKGKLTGYQNRLQAKNKAPSLKR